MLILKLAAVTCAFYLAAAVLMEAVVIALAHRGGFMIFADRLVWIAIFGIVWLVSFLLAWRVVVAPIFANIPK